MFSETERLISTRILTVQRGNHDQMCRVYFSATVFETCSSSPVVVFRMWSELASGVSSSLGGTSCQNIARYLSHSSKTIAPLLLPVFSYDNRTILEMIMRTMIRISEEKGKRELVTA